MKITNLILANSFSRAQGYARELGLKPTEWNYISGEHSLLGHEMVKLFVAPGLSYKFVADFDVIHDRIWHLENTGRLQRYNPKTESEVSK